MSGSLLQPSYLYKPAMFGFNLRIAFAFLLFATAMNQAITPHEKRLIIDLLVTRKLFMSFLCVVFCTVSSSKHFFFLLQFLSFLLLLKNFPSFFSSKNKNKKVSCFFLENFPFSSLKKQHRNTNNAFITFCNFFLSLNCWFEIKIEFVFLPQEPFFTSCVEQVRLK